MSYTIKSILYTSDLTADSPTVFRHAVGLAEQFGAELHAFTVKVPVPPHPFTHYITREQLEEIRAKDCDNRAAQLQQNINRFAANNPEYDVEKVVASVKATDGNIPDSILDAAENVSADIIVMGSRGRSPIGEIFIGSVAAKVTMKAKIPVLLVPFKS